MLLRLQHVQITIPIGAEEQAREFYCTFLGIPEIPKPESLQERGGFWLLLDSFQIHVGSEEGIARSKTKSHLAYEVKDLNAWRKKLESYGVDIIDGIRIPNFERFEFRDPFGNRVEFLEMATV